MASELWNHVRENDDYRTASTVTMEAAWAANLALEDLRRKQDALRQAEERLARHEREGNEECVTRLGYMVAFRRERVSAAEREVARREQAEAIVNSEREAIEARLSEAWEAAHRR